MRVFTQLVMREAEIVETPDEIHSGFQRFYSGCGMAAFAW
jgi:hypothetical protein